MGWWRGIRLNGDLTNEVNRDESSLLIGGKFRSRTGESIA